MIISHFEHLGMTTNFWLCMRQEHDSDKQFARCEHANTNAHVKCLLRLQMCTKQWLCLTLVFCNIQARTALFVSKNIWVEMLISLFLKFSWHILNMNVLYVLLDVYSFGAFTCFRLIAVTFTWGLYLDLSMQSTGVSFLSTLHCRRS